MIRRDHVEMGQEPAHGTAVVAGDVVGEFHGGVEQCLVWHDVAAPITQYGVDEVTAGAPSDFVRREPDRLDEPHRQPGTGELADAGVGVAEARLRDQEEVAVPIELKPPAIAGPVDGADHAGTSTFHGHG